MLSRQEIIRTTEVGQSVEAKFKAFARNVMQVEKKWFSAWADTIVHSAKQHLQQTIFRRNPDTSEAGARHTCTPNAQGSLGCTLASTHHVWIGAGSEPCSC